MKRYYYFLSVFLLLSFSSFVCAETAVPVDTLDYAYSAHVVGNYAYVADGNSGLQIIDVSDKTTPFIAGSVNTPGRAYRVWVSGNYAYIADGYDGGLQVIDISNPDSPIYGMPILDADKAKNVICVKRGKGKGFSGVENALFFLDNTRMLYGDGQDVAGKLIAELKQL